MAIDLAAEVRAALLDPEIRRVYQQEVIKPAVAAALADAAADSWLSAKHAAAYLYGRDGTEERFRKLRERHPELDRLSVGEGKMRRWKRADLDTFLASNPRAQRRRCAKS
jgi:hypothetical protein